MHQSTDQAIKQSRVIRAIYTAAAVRRHFLAASERRKPVYDIRFLLYFASDNNHPAVSVERQILRRDI